ncbi:MAG: Crp/Fnr family transcriptional regulator [Proteobacteria bacterium]|nr:Crp/Fnr family transcriptional regulator [Pseudomonadota bacterium]MBU1610233.1 Crp/Fnr family transcriptional regulator [Pseudomonadota bacterium]
MDKLEALIRTDLFQGIDRELAEKLVEMTSLRTVEKGEIIFHAGEPADGFYSVASGKVRIYRSSPSGKEQIIHVFGPGRAFAEVPMFQGADFPASAQALAKCKLLYFPRQAFTRMMIQHPDLALSTIGLLAARLRNLVNQVSALSLKEVPARLATYLLLLKSSQKGNTLELDLPKGQIASYLGTIQETLSRILKKMTEQGLLEVQGKQVTILDEARLELLAEGEEQL